MKQIIDESIFFNLWKNRYWVSIGVLTIAIAVWLEYQQNQFIVGKLVFGFPYRHMADPYIPVIIGVIGTFSVIVGLWDLHSHNALPINVFLLEVLWITITVSDIERQMADHHPSILVYLGIFIIITAYLEFIAPSVMSLILSREERKTNSAIKANDKKQAQITKKDR